MKSIDFPEANLPLAKDQPEYQTLYVHFQKFTVPYFPMTACFQLTDEEVEEIVRTRKLWFTQSTFGKGFSPITLSLMNPYENPIITDKIPDDENRTPAEAWDKTHFLSRIKVPEGAENKLLIVDRTPCLNCNKMEEEHYWSSRQCEL